MNITKLKQIRKSKGYTLSTLSSIIGCTSSYLSQLERGLKQPSLEMLRRISDCLEVPIFIFFSEAETSDLQVNNQRTSEYSIVRHDNRKKIVMPDILTEYEFITPYNVDGSDNCRIVGMYTTLAPGKWACEKLISLNFDFSVFILKGTATVSLKENTLILQEGDSIYFNSGAKHNFYNSGNEQLVLIGYGERNKLILTHS
ncbi:helix-turn-helix domain-containing protein [Clostridium hydrogenum]|uniref:helix-turn-helix domain-containing protein n=1 Tax=Clostridium hydrogenum TaxID=2855764 RepID=UPI001F38D71B|nr:helix-turn-helix domain-containing protein [Clostridium hydrogenum]